MARFRRIADRVYLVGGGGFSDPADCMVYALDLGQTVLVDSGWGPGWPSIGRNIAAAGLDPARIHTLVLTHAHIDHAGAAAQVKRETGCRIVAHDLDAGAIESGDPVLSAATWYETDLEPAIVDHRMTGSDENLEFERGSLRLVHTPGHTPGSIVAVLDSPEGRILFGQDVHGPFSSSFGSDVGAWRTSMRALIDLEADVLCEGHFGVFHGREAVRRFIERHLAENR